VERPSRLFQIFAPWVPCSLIVLAAWAIGWEGSICIVMSFPLMLVMSSLGGLVAGWLAKRSFGHALVAAALPFALAPLESIMPRPVSMVTNRSEITIRASAAMVWPQVVQVPTIRDAEQRPALFTALGFPRPVSATLDRDGLGGVRHARFEGNVLFLETITRWEDERRIGFTIEAQTDAIPPTTLDPHVTIGGRYFDVLTGEYELQPLTGGRTRVVLTSTHRLPTTLNPYAGLWAGLVMRSIQRNILEVVRARAESTAQ
ncbi:MAG: hypothetical protein ACREMQ_01915, partial [Longimicrobiales bacterium]